jgi:hypothetical protein
VGRLAHGTVIAHIAAGGVIREVENGFALLA